MQNWDTPAYTKEQADRVRELDALIYALIPQQSVCEKRYAQSSALADRALTEMVHRRRRILQMRPKERAREDQREFINKLQTEAVNLGVQLEEIEEVIRHIMHDYRKIDKALADLRRERHEIYMRGLTQALSMERLPEDDPALSHPDILPDSTWLPAPMPQVPLSPIERARAKAEEFFRRERTQGKVLYLPPRPVAGKNDSEVE